MGAFRNVVSLHSPVACTPHEHIVGHVLHTRGMSRPHANSKLKAEWGSDLDDFVRHRHWRDQRPAQESNVLMVPGVAVSDGRTVANAIDLSSAVHHGQVSSLDPEIKNVHGV